MDESATRQPERDVCPVCHSTLEPDAPHLRVDDCVTALDAHVVIDDALRRLLADKHRRRTSAIDQPR